MWTALKTYVTLSFFSLAFADIAHAKMIRRGNPPAPFELLAPPDTVPVCSLTLEDGVGFTKLDFDYLGDRSPRQGDSYLFAGLTASIQDGVPVAPSLKFFRDGKNYDRAWFDGWTQDGKQITTADQGKDGDKCSLDNTFSIVAASTESVKCFDKDSKSRIVGLQDKPENFPTTFPSVFFTGWASGGGPFDKSLFFKGVSLTVTAAPKKPLELTCSSAQGGNSYTITLTGSSDKKVWTAPKEGVEIKQGPPPKTK